MKNFVTIIVLCLSLKLYSQEVEQQFSEGRIVFIQERLVVDDKKLDSSLARNIPPLMSLMKNLLFHNSKKSGRAIDSSEIISKVDLQMKPILENTLDPRKNFLIPLTYKYILKDSIIESTVQDTPLTESEELTVIDRATGKKTYYRLKDSVWILDELTIRGTLKNQEEIELQEFRTIKKKIQGFDCFKVVVTIPQNILESLNLYAMEIPTSFAEEHKELSSLKTTYEMYVTDKIVCRYHPIVHFTEVLDNYYPIEIIKRESLLEGVENRITITELKLY